MKSRYCTTLLPVIPPGWKLTGVYLRNGQKCEHVSSVAQWRWGLSPFTENWSDILSYRIERVDEEESASEASATEAAGRKDDAGKPRVGEVLDGFKRALWAVSKVGTWGGEVKYADRPFDNWCHVEDGIRRYDNGRARHYLAVVDNDPESGMTHEWHAVWCALAALELRLREEENVGE